MTYKHVKYIDIDRFDDPNILKNTVYIPLGYDDSRSIFNAFYINIGFGPRVITHALHYNVYKNLNISLFESDMGYIDPFLADSSIKAKYQIKIKY